jgi:hypothetical protein
MLSGCIFDSTVHRRSIHAKLCSMNEPPICLAANIPTRLPPHRLRCGALRAARLGSATRPTRYEPDLARDPVHPGSHRTPADHRPGRDRRRHPTVDDRARHRPGTQRAGRTDNGPRRQARRTGRTHTPRPGLPPEPTPSRHRSIRAPHRQTAARSSRRTGRRNPSTPTPPRPRQHRTRTGQPTPPRRTNARIEPT